VNFGRGGEYRRKQRRFAHSGHKSQELLGRPVHRVCHPIDTRKPEFTLAHL
jgi:hypothetical protein